MNVSPQVIVLKLKATQDEQVIPTGTWKSKKLNRGDTKDEKGWT